MKKYLLDLRVKSVEQIHQRYVLIRLTDDQPLPEMLPGQFVEIRVDDSPSTFLRRPISLQPLAKAPESWLSCSLAPCSTVCCLWAMGSRCRRRATRRFCSWVVVSE